MYIYIYIPPPAFVIYCRMITAVNLVNIQSWHIATIFLLIRTFSIHFLSNFQIRTTVLLTALLTVGCNIQPEDKR